MSLCLLSYLYLYQARNIMLNFTQILLVISWKKHKNFNLCWNVWASYDFQTFKCQIQTNGFWSAHAQSSFGGWPYSDCCDSRAKMQTQASNGILNAKSQSSGSQFKIFCFHVNFLEEQHIYQNYLNEPYDMHAKCSGQAFVLKEDTNDIL